MKNPTAALDTAGSDSRASLVNAAVIIRGILLAGDPYQGRFHMTEEKARTLCSLAEEWLKRYHGVKTCIQTVCNEQKPIFFNTAKMLFFCS